MIRTEPQAPAETTGWSARHLPEAQIPRGLRLAVLAVAALLVAVVLASALRGPIQTAGTRMEPPRFKVTALQANAEPADKTGTVIAAVIGAGGN